MDKDEANNDVPRIVNDYTLNPGSKEDGNDTSYTAFTAMLQANDGFTKADCGKADYYYILCKSRCYR